jgi:toxin FitB
VLRFLLDTDTIKKMRTEANVRRWLATTNDNELAISVVSLFEISKGIQNIRNKGDASTVSKLEASLAQVRDAFADRTFQIDPQIALEWGTLASSDRKQWMDRCLIATAKIHGLILVSCNSKDMVGHGAEVINPLRNPPGRWSPDGGPQI